ncbi:MAG: diguanylate cyclase [Lachnospiraceae bacterium]|nr:diguanylate cyclase [Lachnospiraceae bacterium]
MVKQNLDICSFVGVEPTLFAVSEKFTELFITNRAPFSKEQLNTLADDRSYLFVADNREDFKEVENAWLRSKYIVYIAETFSEVPGELEPDISTILYLGDPEEEKAYRLTALFHKITSDYKAFMGYNMLNSALNTLPDMMWFKELNGLHHNVNNAFAKIVRKTKEDCEGKTHGYIWNVPEEAAFSCKESEDQVISKKSLLTFQEPVGTDEGMKQFVTYKAPMYDMFQNIIGTVGMGHDITDFENMGIQLTILTGSIPFPVIMCETDWKTIRVNSNFCEFFGLNEEEAEKLYYPDWKKKYMKPVGEPEINETGHAVTQEYLIEYNGKSFDFIVIEQEIRNTFDDLSGYFCLFRDVTIQREYEQTIIDAANTDGLTGIYNRRYFYDYINENIDSEMTLLYMDLDNFKQVNDNFGHARGDEVLIKTAYAIRAIFDEALPVRLGGDEFAALYLRNVSDEDLKDKIREIEFRVRSLLRQNDIGLSVSIGIERKTSEQKDAEAFVHSGDKKMYAIKSRHHEGGSFGQS